MFILASKGFWAEMLGVGDFYYEVSSRDKVISGDYVTDNTTIQISEKDDWKYNLQYDIWFLSFVNNLLF